MLSTYNASVIIELYNSNIYLFFCIFPGCGVKNYNTSRFASSYMDCSLNNFVALVTLGSGTQ